MARSMQTARKSTGGMRPPLHLATMAARLSSRRTTGKVREIHRYRPSRPALREVRMYQKSTGVLVNNPRYQKIRPDIRLARRIGGEPA